ncbi:MAG: discoidin domain-containing protein [Clostridiales bacterium]|nr:discoidin domain-containing protein [Clostridiales bacterium]
MFFVVLWIAVIVGIWYWRKKVIEEGKASVERGERLQKVSSNYENVKIVQTLNNARCKAITSSFNKFFLWEPIDVKKHEYPIKHVKKFACNQEYLFIGRKLNPEFLELDDKIYDKEAWISIGFKRRQTKYTEELAQIQTDIEELLDKWSSLYSGYSNIFMYVDPSETLCLFGKNSTWGEIRFSGNNNSYYIGYIKLSYLTEVRATSTPTIKPTATTKSISECIRKGRLTVSASSWFKGNNPSVEPANMIDGNKTTSWDSDNEWYPDFWFTVTDGNKYTLSGFKILNGKYDQYQYNRNNRVAELKLYVDGQYIATCTVNDQHGVFQTVWLREPVSGTEFRFHVSKIYRGTHPTRDDLCISEFELF